MKISPRWIAALVLGVGVAGCGQQTLPKEALYPARGKVLIGGKPVQMGHIELQPVTPGQGVECQGSIGPGGTFALRTYSNKREPDGAAPGTYKVVIKAYHQTVDGPLPKGVTPTPASDIPAKYAQAGTSDKTVEIKAEQNNLTIDLSK